MRFSGAYKRGNVLHNVSVRNTLFLPVWELRYQFMHNEQSLSLAYWIDSPPSRYYDRNKIGHPRATEQKTKKSSAYRFMLNETDELKIDEMTSWPLMTCALPSRRIGTLVNESIPPQLGRCQVDGEKKKKKKCVRKNGTLQRNQLRTKSNGTTDVDDLQRPGQENKSKHDTHERLWTLDRQPKRKRKT